MDGHLKMAEMIVRDGLLIEGRITKLVPFAEAHLAAPRYLEWLRDRDVVSSLNLPVYLERPVAAETVEAYCNAITESDNDLFLAIHAKPDDSFIGTIKAGHIDWYARIGDIGIMIGDRAYWGRGIAQDSIFALCRYLFDEVALRKLTAGAMATNVAMIKVFEKLGFQHEAKLRAQDWQEDGGYCDHVLLGCFRQELRRPQ